ncbi:MAG: MoxR family ATPase [Deltaproteobacteria bacterium]|nr:MoxR family ATPase [Deltaproteobacteria bacterium]
MISSDLSRAARPGGVSTDVRPAPLNQDESRDALSTFTEAVERIGRVVRGKDEVIRLTLVALFARGHVLLEDVPGVGKTTLARALAQVVGGTFSRIQLTSDLLPADIVGAPALERETGAVRFRPGPIFASVVLADELNRATPRTQSGLLEAMAERSVSVDGTTHALPDPFFVIATQNPVDHHGVYSLPQSQMDRFLIRTEVGYPDARTEHDLLSGRRNASVESLAPVFDSARLHDLFERVERVFVSGPVVDYVQAIVRATREASSLSTGVSTRGALAFVRAVRARALLEGRAFASPDDVRVLAEPVCAHRIALRGADRPTREESIAVFREVLDRVPVPL